MAVLVAVAFMLVAGWQFVVSGTEAPFSEMEVALEKAIAGSTIAYSCKFTGNIDDSCPFGIYQVYNCRKKLQ